MQRTLHGSDQCCILYFPSGFRVFASWSRTPQKKKNGPRPIAHFSFKYSRYSNHSVSRKMTSFLTTVGWSKPSEEHKCSSERSEAGVWDEPSCPPRSKFPWACDCGSHQSHCDGEFQVSTRWQRCATLMSSCAYLCKTL